MSLLFKLVISISCYSIPHMAAFPSNEWHQNLELGKEYYYYTDCITEQSNMIDKCIELGGTTMASIPSFYALIWFQHELITESPSSVCTGNIAFGGIQNGTLSSDWNWLNGDSWVDNIIPWDDECTSSGSDHVLYMIYPSKLFCDASIKDTYSLICERDIIPTELPSANPTISPLTSTSKTANLMIMHQDTKTDPAVIYLGAFIIICIIGIIFVGCILCFMLIGNQRKRRQHAQNQEEHIDNDDIDDKMSELDLNQKPSMTMSPSEEYFVEGYQIPISRESVSVHQIAISRGSSPKVTINDLKVPTLEQVPSISVFPPGTQVIDGTGKTGFDIDAGSDSFSSSGEDSVTNMDDVIGEEKEEKNITILPVNITRILSESEVNTADFIE